MTRDDIIRMAREAGIGETRGWFNCVEEELERFANLVAAAELEACLNQIEIIVEAEREACAKVCDGWPDYDVQGLAEAIRARGNK
jgi:hypothetical protein